MNKTNLFEELRKCKKLPTQTQLIDHLEIKLEENIKISRKDFDSMDVMIDDLIFDLPPNAIIKMGALEEMANAILSRIDTTQTI